MTDKLYLILARSLERAKIGLSNDPERRLKELQTGSPVPLELFAFQYSKRAKAREAELHKKFKNRHLHGEWFDLKPLDYVTILSDWDYDPGIHYSKRTIEQLLVGDLAYISWDGKSLCRVRVVEIHEPTGDPAVEITSKIGEGEGEIGCSHWLYIDEVRKHPIDALINRVTM